MADEHTFFTTAATSYLRNLDREDIRGECIAIHYQDAPVDLGDGRRSMSLNFPLLVVTNYFQEPHAVAEKVARILNEHWERNQ